MAMKRCPICGERYSDTYKNCPFCEEEEALKDGEQYRRRSSRSRRTSRREPNLLSPILIFLILVLLGVLVYLLFGDAIAGKLGLGGEAASSGSVSLQEPSVGSSSGGTGGAGSGDFSMPTVGDDTQTPPDTSVTVNNEDFTLSVGETYSIKASGGSGTYTWESEDPSIASVDTSGRVTAVSAGTTNLTVSDGYTTATSIVRIKGGSAAAGNTGTPGTAALRVSNGDCTLSAGESYIVKASGGSGTYTWASKNPGIAKVDGAGKVTAVASGTTTVTVSDGGTTASCIVRVK